MSRSARWSPLRGEFSTFAFIAAGTNYEITEWLTALAIATDWAEAYSGQQGDMWDAQRDMALAAVGSITAAALFCHRQNKSRQTAVQT